MQELRLGFLGAGRFGSALLEGLAHSGFQGSLSVLTRTQESSQIINKKYGQTLKGLRVATSFQDLCAASDAVCVLIKPHQVAGYFLQNDFSGPGPRVWLSFCAGLSLKELRMAARLPWVRVMGNVSLALGPGHLVATSEADLSENSRALAQEVLSNWGGCDWISEKDFDVATALLGSGPALVLSLLQNALEAPFWQDLDEKLRAQWLLACFESGLKLWRSEGSAAKIRIATPGGCTEAGLRSLESEFGILQWQNSWESILKRMQELAKPT